VADDKGVMSAGAQPGRRYQRTVTHAGHLGINTVTGTDQIRFDGNPDDFHRRT